MSQFKIKNKTSKIVLAILLLTSGAAKALEVSDYKGKVVYLDFWASWCEPCKLSFPWLNKMKSQNPDLVVIGVNLDKEESLAKEFLKESPANFEIIYDPEAKLAEKYNVGGMPYSIVFDKKGIKRLSHVGFTNAKGKVYEQEIKKLLSESK